MKQNDYFKMHLENLNDWMIDYEKVMYDDPNNVQSIIFDLIMLEFEDVIKSAPNEKVREYFKNEKEDFINNVL